MALVDFGVDIRVEASLRTSNVQVLVGACPYPPHNYTTTCADHYLLTMSITPRPPHAWAQLEDRDDLSPSPMGKIMLIPVDCVQRGGFDPISGVRRDVWCLFPRRQFEEMIGCQIDWTPAALNAAVDVRDEHVHASIRRLAQEALSPGMAATVLTDSIAIALAIDLRRYFSRADSPVPEHPQALSSRQLRRLTEYIHEHGDQDMRLNDFARVAVMSVRSLTRAFKQTTGRTLAQYVAETRLQRARELLRSSRMPTKVIAARVGFSNVSSFTSAFRRLVGVTPGQFRAKADGEDGL
jgi:AraC family transcriptional regulator